MRIDVSGTKVALESEVASIDSAPSRRKRHISFVVVAVGLILLISWSTWYFHPRSVYRRQVLSLLSEALELQEEGMAIIDSHGPPGSGKERGFLDDWRTHTRKLDALADRVRHLNPPREYPQTNAYLVEYVDELTKASHALSENPGSGEYAAHLEKATVAARNFTAAVGSEAEAIGSDRDAR